MNFIELNQDLKRTIHSLYNITGGDIFLIAQAINNIKTATIYGFEEFNFQKLDASSIKVTELEPVILSLPMNNKYKLIILSNPSQDVEKYLNNFNFSGCEHLVIACVNATNLKIATQVDCSKLDRIDINKYILNYLSKIDQSIEEQALDYLINATASDMGKIVNELSKLSAYCVDTEIITLETVTNIVSNTEEFVLYMLTNAIDKKGLAEYQKILNTMSKSQTFSEIFSYLGKYFRRMQYIAINKNDTELSKILNIKPYAIKKAREHIQKNGIKYYINLYQTYTNLDHAIKSGKISPYNALYKLIFF